MSCILHTYLPLIHLILRMVNAHCIFFTIFVIYKSYFMLACYFALPELNFCSPHDIIADLFTLYSHRKIPGTLIR